MATFPFVILAVVSGALLAIAPIPLAVLYAALIGIVLVVMLDDFVAILGSIIITLFVVGPAESLARIPKIFWVPYLLGLFLFAKALVKKKTEPLSIAPPRETHFPQGGWLAIIFIATVSFSTVLAQPDFFQLALGSRDYLWLWGFLAVVAIKDIPIRTVSKWFRILPWVVVLQTPLTIYQHFFVIGSTRLTTHDAVVGLFGGNPEGGGASGAMGFFSLLVALYAVARTKNGCMSKWMAFSVITCALISIGLAEVKFVAISAPIIAIAFFGLRQLIKSAVAFLWVITFVVTGPLILYGYWKAFEAPGAKGFGSFDKYIEVIVERNTDDRQIDYLTGEMGRVTALKFWATKNNAAADPVTFTLGHGIGASRIGMFAGEVAKKYPFNIARSSLAVFLWETGVLGTFCIFLFLLSAYFAARRSIATDISLDKESKSALQLASGIFAVAILTLPYNTDLIGTPQFQVLVVLGVASLIARRSATLKQSVQT